MSRFLEYIEEKKCKSKKKKEVSEAVKLVFASYHLKDNILDNITVEELQTMVDSNVPSEKINNNTVQKEFETLLREKINDARAIARKVIPELVKDFNSMKEAFSLSKKDQKKIGTPMKKGDKCPNCGKSTKICKNSACTDEKLLRRELRP